MLQAAIRNIKPAAVAPAKQLLTFRLTHEQYVSLTPFIDYKLSDGKSAVFMTCSNIYDPATGDSVAMMQVACLPWDEAKAVVNMIRKLFGLPLFKLKKRKTTP